MVFTQRNRVLLRGNKVFLGRRRLLSRRYRYAWIMRLGGSPLFFEN